MTSRVVWAAPVNASAVFVGSASVDVRNGGDVGSVPCGTSVADAADT